MLVPELINEALLESVHRLILAHAPQVFPSILAPPPRHPRFRILQPGDRACKPTRRNEVENLYFRLRLAACHLPNGLPVAFERSLVQKTERGGLLTNSRLVENGGDLCVEVALENVDGPSGSLGLSIPELLESRHLSGLVVAECELPHASRLALEDQLRGPAIGLIRLLRPGKAVDIDAMSRNQNEIVQIAADQLRLVLGPQRSVERAEDLLLRRRGRKVEQGELFLVCHCRRFSNYGDVEDCSGGDSGTKGIASHVRPSNSRPACFFRAPPHCLKKKATPCSTH